MAEEAIVAAGSPAPLEHKRKREDGETEALEPSMADSNAVEKAAVAAGDSGESEAKWPRTEEQPDELVTENGFQEQKVDEHVREDVEPPSVDSGSKIENAQESINEEASEMVNKEQASNDDHQMEDIQQTIVDNAELENSQQQPYRGVLQGASAQVPQQGDISSSEQKPASDTQTTSQKIEAPNNKEVFETLSTETSSASVNNNSSFSPNKELHFDLNEFEQMRQAIIEMQCEIEELKQMITRIINENAQLRQWQQEMMAWQQEMMAWQQEMMARKGQMDQMKPAALKQSTTIAGPSTGSLGGNLFYDVDEDNEGDKEQDEEGINNSDC